MAVPFFGLIVLAKIMGPLRLAVLARLPQRYYWDLPEIPLAAYFGITLFGVVMQRYVCNAADQCLAAVGA